MFSAYLDEIMYIYSNSIIKTTSAAAPLFFASFILYRHLFMLEQVFGFNYPLTAFKANPNITN